MGPKMRCLIDENVRTDVALILESRGHEVIYSRDVLATSAPDQLLAVLGKYENLVVVTHDKHFRKYRALLPEHERSRFSQGAGRLSIEVAYEKSPQRVAEEIENIEYFYIQALRNRRQFLMSIMDVNIRVTTK